MRSKQIETLIDYRGERYALMMESSMLDVNKRVFVVYKSGHVIIHAESQKEAHDGFKRYSAKQQRLHEEDLVIAVLR